MSDDDESQQKTLACPHLATPAIKPQVFEHSRPTGQAGHICHQSIFQLPFCQTKGMSVHNKPQLI